jgi:type IV pilus assembly protein PilB
VITATAPQPLGQRLLGKGLVQPAQLDRALEEQRRGGHLRLLGEILVRLRHCTEAQVAQTLAESYGLPFATITPALADPAVLHLLPRAFVEAHGALPLFLVEGVLTVAVPEPADVVLLGEIERLAGRPIQVVVCTAADVAATLRRFRADRGTYERDRDAYDAYDVRGALTAAASDGVGGADPLPLGGAAAADNDADETPEATAARFVNFCVYQAVKLGATEIHFESGGAGGTPPPPRVRFRIDGRLAEEHRLPAHLHAAALAARVKVLAGLDATARLPQEGTVQFDLDRRPVELRVSTMPVAAGPAGPAGERVVLRVVHGSPERAAPPNLERLGFAYETLKPWRKLIALPAGLVLVTGPAGAGRRTTCYASLLERAAADDLNVCTLEERPSPVALSGVNQFTVGEDTGLTYPGALRALLRQNPDVLMVGELRDAETAGLALRAALEGRLVFAAMTLHAGDAPAAVARLLGLGGDPFLLASTLAGVPCQRTARKLCTACREPYAPPSTERRPVERDAGPVDVLYRPKGCPRCRDSGFSGRLGIYELLVADDPLAELITRAAPVSELREYAHQSGLRPLRADGMEKVKAGLTSLAELYRVLT